MANLLFYFALNTLSMKKFLLYLLLFLLFLILIPIFYFQFSECGISPFSCGDYTNKTPAKTQKISLGSGPEDMAIDTSMGYSRIIVSCTQRRKAPPRTGGFYAINPRDNSTFQFQIEPADFKIHPHGIDVVTIDSIPYLYAISHDQEGANWRHRVFRFEVKENILILDKQHIMEDELMSVPNDLDVLEDGSFYATNYVPNMNPTESTKAILGIKNGSIVHYDGKGNWKIILDKMCYPNGIWVNPEKEYLLVANGGCQEVLRYKINQGKVNSSDKLSTKSHQVNIPIGDNLMLDNQGILWVSAHPCPLKFLNHAKDPNEKSPMQIFALDPMTLKTNKIFQNNGELISAASTVLHINNRLYISQVFDPFVLVLEGY